MKRTALALVAAPVLALGLAACSSDAPAPAPVVTVTQQDPDTGSTTDALFVAKVRQGAPSITAGASDAKIVKLGHSTCDALGIFNGDADALFESMYAQDPNLNYGDVGFFVGSSISVYCPEYKAQNA